MTGPRARWRPRRGRQSPTPPVPAHPRRPRPPLQQSNSAGLVVISEEDTRTLLIHRLCPDDIYQRQGGAWRGVAGVAVAVGLVRGGSKAGRGGGGPAPASLAARPPRSPPSDDTIITWPDPALGTDIALSFQDAGGCNHVW